MIGTNILKSKFLNENELLEIFFKYLEDDVGSIDCIK